MTTTPAAVLTKLQAAWHNAAAVATNSEAEAEPATIPYCGPHNDAADWKLSADKYNRPGWHTVHCKRCGRFIGYQPPSKERRQLTPTERNEP